MIASRSQVGRNTPFKYRKIAHETHEKHTQVVSKLYASYHFREVTKMVENQENQSHPHSDGSVFCFDM